MHTTISKTRRDAEMIGSTTTSALRSSRIMARNQRLASVGISEARLHPDWQAVRLTPLPARRRPAAKTRHRRKPA